MAISAVVLAFLAGLALLVLGQLVQGLPVFHIGRIHITGIIQVGHCVIQPAFAVVHHALQVVPFGSAGTGRNPIQQFFRIAQAV